MTGSLPHRRSGRRLRGLVVLTVLAGSALVVPGSSYAAGGPAPASPTAASTVARVTNTADSGPGSLRAAIADANDRKQSIDRVEFHIPGIPLSSPVVIRPQTDLPALMEPVVIDGYTQRGSAPRTSSRAADIEVQINAHGLTRGLELKHHSSVSGLAIFGAGGAGIVLDGDRNAVTGSYLGVTSDGAAIGNSGYGIVVTGADNHIGGSAAADRNVVAANGSGGVSLGGDRNVVENNRIGLGPGPAAVIPNRGPGVDVSGDDNVIGHANEIAGNTADGILVDDGEHNAIVGNAIGTDAAGESGLGNRGGGVYIVSAHNAVVGNLIGGNRDDGVHIDADDAEIYDNHIGLMSAPSGPVPLPNLDDGIANKGARTTIGRAGHGNVIAANGANGINLLSGTTDAVVAANTIGTDEQSRPGLGNTLDGISLYATASTIGGASIDLQNVVSDNGDDGIAVAGDDNTIEGNRVGGPQGGNPALGNADDGMQVTGDDNWVRNNTVALNGAAAIAVPDLLIGSPGTNNALTGNLTFGNTGLGIDIGPVGVTPNDNLDADPGANDLLNTPTVTSAAVGSGKTTVGWSIDAGLPNTTFQVEFFVANGCTAAVRNAEVALGTITITTDANGDTGAQSTDLPDVTAPGQVVTATATQVTGTSPLTLGSTSELSNCQRI